ncbi:MAG: DUF4846 domain-containing protein, partial [Bacteroidota bacterium]
KSLLFDLASVKVSPLRTSVSESKQTNTIEKRFNPPKGYKRVKIIEDSFEAYLRTLKLKPKDARVKYHSGTYKSPEDIYCAVVDLDIGNKNLHQCADAVIRLKAEYHWQKKEYDQIEFKLTNGFNVPYANWLKGMRVDVKGNTTKWISGFDTSNSYEDFWKYLEFVFMYAGTASLEKEMHPKNIEKAEIGDVLIKGGFPGHAVIIVDKAIHLETGEAVYLLAQSYMPAQEIQILNNPNNEPFNPWYRFDQDMIITPEWVFESINLREF